MRGALMKARWLLLLVPLVAIGCKDDPPPSEETPDAGALSCLDNPTALAKPPSGQLPCELYPPGFKK